MGGKYIVTYKDPEGKVLSDGHVYYMPVTLWDQKLLELGPGHKVECYFPEWGITLKFENKNGVIVEC